MLLIMLMLLRKKLIQFRRTLFVAIGKAVHIKKINSERIFPAAFIINFVVNII